jgi:hypothetical protein
VITKRLALCLLAAMTFVASPKKALTLFEYTPPDGFVPDAETAEKMAEVLLTRMYGDYQIELEMPLRATLNDNVWIVRGSAARIQLGGVAEMHIKKSDARIVYFKHEA